MSVLNPSDIIPFLKKTLFEYLQTLTFESLPEKQIINQLYLLISLIKHGREIVQPYSANIANVLLQHLKGSTTSASVVSYLLQAFSSLSENSSSDILVFLSEIFHIIIKAMQDKSSTIKREAAVKSLNQIIKNTGFVVIPYYLFPSLMDIILQLIRGEVYPEMRQECMRLLGNLGAIDSFNYKKILGRVKKLEDVPYKFKFIQKYFQSINSSQQNQLINEVHNYYEDLILLGNFYDSKRMFMHLASIKLESDLPLEKEIEIDQNTTTPQTYYASSVASIDLDLLTPPVIQLNNIDYYSTVTIKTLLMIMLDTSLQTHHELALETLMCIVGTLKAKTANYLQYLVPVFAKLL